MSANETNANEKGLCGMEIERDATVRLSRQRIQRRINSSKNIIFNSIFKVYSIRRIRSSSGSSFREESKQDSDMDDPWIMTVKGPHVVKGPVVPMLPLDEQPPSLTLTHTPNHRSTNHNQQAKPHANGTSRSPPNDSTLNHYRSESRDSVRDGQAKHTPVSCKIKFDRKKKKKEK